MSKNINVFYKKDRIKEIPYELRVKGINSGWCTTECPYGLLNYLGEIQTVGSRFETSCPHCLIISLNPNITYCDYETKENKDA